MLRSLGKGDGVLDDNINPTSSIRVVCLFKRETPLMSRQSKVLNKVLQGFFLLQLSFLSEGTGRRFGVIISHKIGQLKVGAHTKNYVTKGDYYNAELAGQNLFFLFFVFCFVFISV